LRSVRITSPTGRWVTRRTKWCQFPYLGPLSDALSVPSSLRCHLCPKIHAHVI
jgi:hypothetical protein